MLNIKETLAKDIKEGIRAAIAAGDLSAGDLEEVVVTRSAGEGHGDYSSAVALAWAKEAGKPPVDIVKVVAGHMPKREYIGRITAAKPGFLNVWLNVGWLTARLDNVLDGDICQVLPEEDSRQVNLEFISANPTGPLTLGNVRTAFSADTLGRVLECAGYGVTREYYINDYGGQIKRLGESVMRRALEEAGAKVEFGEDLYQGDYIKDVSARVVEKRRENRGEEVKLDDLEDAGKVEEMGRLAAEFLLMGIKRMVEKELKIKFDVWTSERKLREAGVVDQAMGKLKAKDLVYAKEGAQYLKLDDPEVEDPVLVKGDDEYTYLVPDIANHLNKFAREYDKILTYVGADHKTHGDRIKLAMGKLDQPVERLEFMLAQWMGVIRGGEKIKMSKRAGKLYSPTELLGEIGYDAARFFMVKQALSSHMDLDIDLARERSERNPVYYVQYAYVRLQSILRQAKQRGVIDEVGMKVDLSDNPRLTQTTELDLIKQLYRFPEEIADITKTYEVQGLAYFGQDVAKAVHVFYRHVRVLDADDEKVVMSRLQLVLAARAVLGKVLDLLGISKPDVM